MLSSDRSTDFARRAARARAPLYDHDLGVKWIPPELTEDGHWGIEALQPLAAPPTDAIPARVYKTLEVSTASMRFVTHITLLEDDPCA